MDLQVVHQLAIVSKFARAQMTGKEFSGVNLLMVSQMSCIQSFIVALVTLVENSMSRVLVSSRQLTQMPLE